MKYVYILTMLVVLSLTSFDSKEKDYIKQTLNLNDNNELIILGIKEIETPISVGFRDKKHKYSPYSIYIDNKDTSKIKEFSKKEFNKDYYSFIKENKSYLFLTESCLSNSRNPSIKKQLDSLKRTISKDKFEYESFNFSKQVSCGKYNGRKKFIHGLIKVSYYNNITIEDKPIVMEDSPNVYLPFLCMIQ